jgi:ATPase family associated with various cellular activities (AAA)/AAA lid domain
VSAPSSLATALDALVAVGARAGLDDAAVRAEGAALAAALAESVPGAPAAWGAVVGGDTQAFFDAAVRSRRWRDSATDLLAQLSAEASPVAGEYARALVGVTAAACDLGEPTVRAVANASIAAAAQLRSAGVRATPTSPSGPSGPSRVTPPSGSAGDTQPATQAAEATAPAAPAPAAPPRSLGELLAELDALIGLTSVKREIHRQAAVLRIEKLRAEAGLKQPTITRHLVFVGNPGTGKTTVARLVAGIYQALGLLTGGQLVEVDRSELVAGYLGQTATKTADVVAKAIGGVLFIDEAYSLAGDQYGQEAIDTLVKEMEDHRDDLVVVVAGYPAPMATFISTNPGLASRFRTLIAFEDYTDDELVAIFEQLAEQADYAPTPECVARMRELLATVERGPGFGNGRFSRNVFETAVGSHAWRLRDVESPTPEQLRRLLPDDLVEAATDDPPVEGDQPPDGEKAADGDMTGKEAVSMTDQPVASTTAGTEPVVASGEGTNA